MVSKRGGTNKVSSISVKDLKMYLKTLKRKHDEHFAKKEIDIAKPYEDAI
jgi:hypothetical protein